MDGVYIDPRLGFEAYLKYEPYILQALENWPATTRFVVDPGMSPATFVARMRDAIAGYRMYNWPASKIPRDIFLAAEGKFVLRLDIDHAILFTTRRQQGRKQTEEVVRKVQALHNGKLKILPTLTPPPVKQDQVVNIKCPLEVKDIETLLSLISRGAFEFPVILNATRLTYQEVEQYELLYPTLSITSTDTETIIL